MAWPIFRRGKDKPIQIRLPSFMWSPRGDRSLEGSEGIFSAVTRLSNSLAATPFHLYKDSEIAKDDPLERLFGHQAAPGVTPFTYKSTLETCRSTNGNGYALKVPGLAGGVERLDILDPERVEPLREEDSGDIWYRIYPQSGGEMYVHYMEMIHVRQITTGGMKGISPITVLQDAMDYDDQMKSFSLKQLQGVNSCVVLEFPSNLGPEARKKIIEDFMGNYQQSAGNLIVLSGGVKSEVLTKSPVDSKVLDVERVTKSRIATVYTLPHHMLGNFDNASYGSNEQQMLEFLQMTMHAIFQQYEDEHNLKLLTWDKIKEGYHFAFSEDEMIIPTRLQKAQEAQYYMRSAVKTSNELRKEHGKPTLPGGDVLMASRDLAPLNYLIENPEKVRRNT